MDHDAGDRDAARELVTDGDTEYVGVLYQDEDSVPFGEREGLDQNMADIPDGAPEDAMDLVREFY
jgi:2-oxoglutarate ferredoxin oxidoreductase subunit beta